MSDLVPVLPDLAHREPGSRLHVSERPLRIAQVAPPMEAVPPSGYGGTERIVAELVDELTRRGHSVTLFASGDSTARCELVPTVPTALRPLGFNSDPTGYLAATIAMVRGRQTDFDVIHAHLEWANLMLMRATTTPTVATFHGRLDHPWATDALADPPSGLVAISRSHAATHPEVPWAGVVYNGLSLEGAPFERQRTDALCFVGRIAPEKGVVDAIEIARLSGRPLKIVAKLGPTPIEQEYAEAVFRPALERADVEFLGELSGAERDAILASSYALLMPGTWPEPFGLVAIEAMACGAPVVARRTGALPELVREGIDGFLGDDPANLAFLLERVDDLDRDRIRADVIKRFSARRMVDGYLEVYRRRLAGEDDPPGTNRLLHLSSAAGGA
ncbi:MAG: glycosyltransferase family 4 protein [Candidatus Limnocylindrales bacterium]